jgi:hypothetical protein
LRRRIQQRYPDTRHASYIAAIVHKLSGNG